MGTNNTETVTIFWNDAQPMGWESRKGGVVTAITDADVGEALDSIRHGWTWPEGGECAILAAFGPDVEYGDVGQIFPSGVGGETVDVGDMAIRGVMVRDALIATAASVLAELMEQ